MAHDSFIDKLNEKYPDIFKAMYEHDGDDLGVTYSKLACNANGVSNYWTPEGVDMEPLYEEIRNHIN